jgi:hypothetical protein
MKGGADLADGRVGRDLVPKFREHRGIANPASGHLYRPAFQSIRIDTQMDLAPLSRPGSSMFLGKPLGKPLAFSLGLDPGAVPCPAGQGMADESRRRYLFVAIDPLPGR